MKLIKPRALQRQALRILALITLPALLFQTTGIGFSLSVKTAQAAEVSVIAAEDATKTVVTATDEQPAEASPETVSQPTDTSLPLAADGVSQVQQDTDEQSLVSGIPNQLENTDPLVVENNSPAPQNPSTPPTQDQLIIPPVALPDVPESTPCNTISTSDGTLSASSTTGVNCVGSLSMKKIVDFGSANPDTFSFTINPDPNSTGTIHTTNGAYTYQNLPPGEYTVTENGFPGYSIVSNTCTSVKVTAGHETACEFHNRQDTGTVIVHKNVVAPDGVTDVIDAHPFTVRLNTASPQTITETTTVTYTDVPTGDNVITEDTDANYTQVPLPNDGHIIVPKDEKVDVYIVNKQLPATITLIKDVRAFDGSDTSDTTVFDVALAGTHKNFAEGSSASFSVNPGTYTAVETQNPEYVISNYLPLDTVTVGSNEQKTITVLNRQNRHGISITKKDSADPIAPGATVTYTLTWKVTGNTPVTNLALMDPLPQTLTFVSATGGGTTSGTNPVVVTWNLGNHQPGETGIVTVTVTAAASLSNGSVITNPAILMADETGPVSTSENTTIAAAPILTISKVVNLPFANPGDQPTYTVTITNIGNDKAVNLVLTDTLPTGFTFVDGGGTTKTFTLGTLEKGKSITTSYKAAIGTSITADTYKNLATAKADNAGPVSAIAPLEVRIPVVAAATEAPSLTLKKHVNEKIANPGDTLTYVITISNSGNAAAQDVRLTDTLPKDFTYNDTNSSKRVWVMGTLLAGEMRTITYQVLVGSDAQAGKHTNTVRATASGLNPLSATTSVDVRIPKVLGAIATTGASPTDLAIFLSGFALICVAGFSLRKLRELPAETL